MITKTTNFEKHPCFHKGASAKWGRVHLPIAPNCNIQCNFCNRKYDCANENRPGVTSHVYSPDEALHFVEDLFRKRSDISVIGVAGPGDPLCDADRTISTLATIRRHFPDILYCVSTNGLNLPNNVDGLIKAGVTHVTVTVNAVSPDVAAKVYAYVKPHAQKLTGETGGALLLAQQDEGIKRLKRHGVIVKINTVVIPGINDFHVPAIAKQAALWHADIMNCMAMIPVTGTPFASIQTPTGAAITEIRAEAGKYMHQMYHCCRCRADAIGKLCPTGTCQE